MLKEKARKAPWNKGIKTGARRVSKKSRKWSTLQRKHFAQTMKEKWNNKHQEPAKLD